MTLEQRIARLERIQQNNECAARVSAWLYGVMLLILLGTLFGATL